MAGPAFVFVLAAASTAPLPPAPPPELPAEWSPPVVHAATLFTVMRTAEAVMWPEPFADLGSWGFHAEEAFTLPPLFDPKASAFEWDHDSWALNVFGHGLLGSELYLRARTCRFGALGSLLFAAGASAVWEYAFEANGVRPSAQDLVYTPLAGLLLGEARYFVWSAAGELPRGAAARSVLRLLVDPLGETERGFVGTGC